MMANYRLFARCAVPFMAMAAAPLYAQSPDPDRNELTVAVGVGALPRYKGAKDSIITPGVLARGRVENFTFFSRGSNLYVDLIRDQNSAGLDLEFGPVVNYRADRHKHIKDARVAALGKLDAALEIGAWAGIAKRGVFTGEYDNLSLRVTYAHDISNAHDSTVITPAIEYGTPISPTVYIGASASANYVGKGFGRYYFDVSPAGSLASGLTAYNGAGSKSGFSDVNFILLAGKSLSGDLRKGWALFTVGGYGKVLGRIRQSPIVRDAGSSDQWTGGVGVAYTF